MGLFGKKPKNPPPNANQPKSPPPNQRLPPSGPKPPPPGAVILAPDQAAARALDAADGVIDGKYFGAPVFQKGPGASPAAPASQHPSVTRQPTSEPIYGLHSTRTIHELGHPPYAGSVTRPSYDPRSFDGPLDPRNYAGKVISVDYYIRGSHLGSGYNAPPPIQYTAPPPIPYQEFTSYHQEPAYMRSPTYLAPRSYPARPASAPYAPYDYGHRYEPPAPPPRYTPPPPAPRYEPPPPSYIPPPPQYSAPPPQPRTVPMPQTQPAPDPNANLRPWFGVAVKWLDDLDQGGRNNVAVVHEVIPDSPAWKAGIQVDDQLEFWENTKIDSEPVWKSKISTIRIGDVINVGIHRNHQDQRVLVRIEGTSQRKDGKRTVLSSNTTHTDN